MRTASVIFFLVLFSSCASQYKLEEHTPNGIGDVFFQKTIAGQEKSPVEYKIFVPVLKETPELQKVYFRGKSAPLKKESSNLYTAAFLFSENSGDMIMSANPAHEYGNKVYQDPDFPFELNQDDVVIGYVQAHKTLFFKIEKIKEKQPHYLPQKNRENN